MQPVNPLIERSERLKQLFKKYPGDALKWKGRDLRTARRRANLRVR